MGVSCGYNRAEISTSITPAANWFSSLWIRLAAAATFCSILVRGPTERYL